MTKAPQESILKGMLDLQKHLPDARLSETNRNTICGPIGIMAEVFCINCGCSGGLITDEWAQKVVYLCDPCSETYGKLANKIPEELIRNFDPCNPEN